MIAEKNLGEPGNDLSMCHFPEVADAAAGGPAGVGRGGADAGAGALGRAAAALGDAAPGAAPPAAARPAPRPLPLAAGTLSAHPQVFHRFSKSLSAELHSWN